MVYFLMNDVGKFFKKFLNNVPIFVEDLCEATMYDDLYRILPLKKQIKRQCIDTGLVVFNGHIHNYLSCPYIVIYDDLENQITKENNTRFFENPLRADTFDEFVPESMMVKRNVFEHNLRKLFNEKK